MKIQIQFKAQNRMAYSQFHCTEHLRGVGLGVGLGVGWGVGRGVGAMVGGTSFRSMQ